MHSRLDGSWSTSLAVLAGNVAVTLAQLVVFALFGQFVGTDTLGAYSLCLAISTPVFTVMGLALRNLVVASPEAWTPRSCLFWATAIGAVASLVSAVVAIALGAPLPLLLVVCLIKALDNATFASVGVLQRRGRLRAASTTLVANALVTGLAGTVAVVLGGGTAGILTASVLGSACPLALCLLLLRRSTSTEVHVPAPFRLLVSRGFPMSSGSAIVALATAMPVYFLGNSSQLAVAAAYTVLSNLRGGLTVPPVALAQVGIGNMSVCFRANDAVRLKAAYRRTFLSVSVCTGAAALLLVIAGEVTMSLVFDIDLRDGPQAMLAAAGSLVLVGWIIAVDARMQAVQAYSVHLPSSVAGLLVTSMILASLDAPISLVAALNSVTAGLTTSLLVKYLWTRRAVRRFEAAAAGT